MHSKVQHVYKNMRYKILKVNDEFYILDMDRSFWFFFIPFIYWVLPHNVYKIDEDILKQIQMPKNKQMGIGSIAFFSAGISIFLVNFLKPVLHQINIYTSVWVNTILLILFMLLGVVFRLVLHKRLFRNLTEIINLDDLETITIKIQPSKKDYFLKYLLSFLFAWGLTSMFGFAFLSFGNVMLLLSTLMLMFIGLILNSQAIPVGSAKVNVVIG